MAFFTKKILNIQKKSQKASVKVKLRKSNNARVTTVPYLEANYEALIIKSIAI